jgi:dTDP-4-dehydrorhamnose 3,5-epimerase
VHGFQALTDEVDICYKHDAYYDPALEIAVKWDDPELAIAWPLADPTLSARDVEAPSFAEVRPLLTAWYGSTAPAPG